jgi:Poly(ADP-ribose) polymerase catalytic domain
VVLHLLSRDQIKQKLKYEMAILKYIDEWRVGFCRRRRQMARDGGNIEPVPEKHLFHGTSRRAVDAICLNNFDWRLCGSHGTMYGQGTLSDVACVSN